MSDEAKRNIQKAAWKLFPAQELWIDKKNNFWAYEKKENEVVVTSGKYIDKIEYSTYTEKTDNVDELVDSLTENKTKEGYECFAIEL